MVRSGTTWIGKMLTAGGGVTYLSEPLNPGRPGIFRLPVNQDYTYIHAGNEAQFLPVFREAVRLRSHPLAELGAVRTPMDVGRVVVRAAQFGRGRVGGHRVLFKDPHAVLSTEWFADRLGCRVVVAVRHPAAVVSSLKRLDWRAPLAGLNAQTTLVHDWLEPFREELRSAQTQASLRRDIVWSNAVLWRIIYSQVADFAERRRDFIIVRHEDLSWDPEGGYARLYEALEMPFEKRAVSAVKAMSATTNPDETPVDKPHSVRLDSRASLGGWQRRLDSAETETIRSLTAPIASRWYGDDDWDSRPASPPVSKNLTNPVRQG
jgi:hypothetical protein